MRMSPPVFPQRLGLSQPRHDGTQESGEAAVPFSTRGPLAPFPCEATSVARCGVTWFLSLPGILARPTRPFVWLTLRAMRQLVCTPGAFIADLSWVALSTREFALLPACWPSWE